VQATYPKGIYVETADWDQIFQYLNQNPPQCDVALVINCAITWTHSDFDI
jgi:hypothetical protein